MLDVSGNDLSGTTPSTFGSMTSLTYVRPKPLVLVEAEIAEFVGNRHTFREISAVEARTRAHEDHVLLNSVSLDVTAAEV